MANSYLQSLLGEHEKILLTARQHWFILFSSIFLEIFLILIFLAATVILSLSFPPFTPLIVAVGFILILIPAVTMTRDILLWSNRQYIVTNRRVMQIAGIINKNITDSSLEKVNDVKMMQSFVGRTFGYGDIEILTASELGVNLFKRIDDPIAFKIAMLNAKERMEFDDRDVRPVKPAEQDVPAMIAQLDQLRKQGVLTEEEFAQKKRDLLAKM
ncbi:MAG: PH domain-containing protein [Anaerolineales bacterium]|nr:PH domain-containing protein [Anaerolineales bacterium]